MHFGHRPHRVIGPLSADSIGLNQFRTGAGIGMGLETLEGIGQQRGRCFVFDVKPSQGIFVHATGGQNLFECFIGEPVYRSTETPEQ
ncbi:hypothetical protein D9M71_530360 [compost metagenome]